MKKLLFIIISFSLLLLSCSENSNNEANTVKKISVANQKITFEVEGRSAQFLATLDARTETIESTVQLAVRKAAFQINLIRLHSENYLGTLRNKLMWGLDTRN